MTLSKRSFIGRLETPARQGSSQPASKTCDAMARRRTSKRSRSARAPRARLARMFSFARERIRVPELEQQHLDVAGLGLLALAAFFAFVLYFGWDGGRVGGALALALRFLLGGVAYLVPAALLGAGAVLVLRPVLPSTRPFRCPG